MADPKKIETGKGTEATQEKPPVPPGQLLVTAVRRGYGRGCDIEAGESFTIAIQPLNPKTGLPNAYSDHTVRIAPGLMGWMKPADDEEAKKLVDLKAAFAKGGVAAATASLPGPAVDLAKENAALKEQLKKLQEQAAAAAAGKPGGKQ